jgi:hypothetical protein
MDDNGMMQEKPPLDVPLHGNNSLQRIALNEENVVQLQLNLRRSGAVSSLSFCNSQVNAMPLPQGSESSSPTILSTFSLTMVQPLTEAEMMPTRGLMPSCPGDYVPKEYHVNLVQKIPLLNFWSVV